MSTFLVYLYKKKPFRALKHTNTHTPEHQIMCSNSVLRFCATCAILLVIKLSCVLAYIISLFFTGGYYLSRTAHWWLLSLVHSALVDIIPCAQRTGGYYPLCTAHWWILSLVHSALVVIIPCAQRTGGYYPLCTPHWWILSLVHSALVDIIPCAQRTGGYYSLCTAHWWLLSIFCLLRT